LAFAFAKPNVLDRAVGFQHVAQRLRVWCRLAIRSTNLSATTKV